MLYSFNVILLKDKQTQIMPKKASKTTFSKPISIYYYNGTVVDILYDLNTSMVDVRSYFACFI